MEISLVKSIEQNEHFGIGTNGEMKNISFGLFAAEEIVSHADDTAAQMASQAAMHAARFQSTHP